MKQLTLVFLTKEDKVLLAMKKRGFGAGRWNGLGGKVSDGETVEGAMAREAQEEAMVVPAEYEKVADIVFDEMGPQSRELHKVDVFLCRSWEGEPAETEEMAPKWFRIDELPLDKMWDDDQYWLPRVLNGEKLKCRFVLNDRDKVIEKKLTALA
ncbi:MAG TPA: 8-oxo-dGTP diphosphatase [Candidatus Saccharimonadales bacterium]|nr:8-oxo-dGTP diphosphatase [Candidatus Saccharimonadales bacterium]